MIVTESAGREVREPRAHLLLVGRARPHHHRVALRGEPAREALAHVWKDFGVTVKDLGNGQIQHTNLTTLIDQKGIRRVDYYGDKWQEKEILKDIARLSSSRRR